MQAFWDRVDVRGPDECWPWTGALQTAGYGALSVDGKQVTAHRFAWFLTNGEIPPGKLIRHSCDNPPCCNPWHLSPGTRAQNSQDMVKRGRSATGLRHNSVTMPEAMLRGSKRSNSKLTETLVEFVLHWLRRGYPQSQIGEVFEVSQGVVNKINVGQAWSHVQRST